MIESEVSISRSWRIRQKRSRFRFGDKIPLTVNDWLDSWWCFGDCLNESVVQKEIYQVWMTQARLQSKA